MFHRYTSAGILILFLFSPAFGEPPAIRVLVTNNDVKREIAANTKLPFSRDAAKLIERKFKEGYHGWCNWEGGNPSSYSITKTEVTDHYLRMNYDRQNGFLVGTVSKAEGLIVWSGEWCQTSRTSIGITIGKGGIHLGTTLDDDEGGFVFYFDEDGEFLAGYGGDYGDRNADPYFVSKKGAEPQKLDWWKIYLVEVDTGHGDSAGTDADVYITLFGKDGSRMPEQELDNEENNFEEDDHDRFWVGTDGFGEIEKIIIRHNNRDDHAGWLLKEVRITDYKSKIKWTFPVNRWLQVEGSNRKKLKIEVKAK